MIQAIVFCVLSACQRIAIEFKTSSNSPGFEVTYSFDRILSKSAWIVSLN